MNEINYEVGRVYKICKNEKVPNDYYFVVTKIENGRGIQRGTDKYLTISLLDKMGEYTNVYQSDMKDWKIEFVS